MLCQDLEEHSCPHVANMFVAVPGPAKLIKEQRFRWRSTHLHMSPDVDKRLGSMPRGTPVDAVEILHIYGGVCRRGL